MKYQLEITTLLVPVNVHQLFEKCEWPELNCFDREMVEGYFSDLVNGIQTDEALDDWTLTVVLYIGTYLARTGRPCVICCAATPFPMRR